MNDIQLYTKGITVESLSGDMLFESTTERSVTLKDVDASDFTSEFSVGEILSSMEFSDVADWVMKQTSYVDIDFSGAE